MARTFFSLLAVATLCSVGFGASLDPSRPIHELRLTNGTVLREVKIVAMGSTTVVATWEGGKGTILLSQLPADLRSDLNRQLESKKVSRPSSENLSASDAKLGADGLPFRIKLNNGFLMRDCSIMNWSKDAVIVRFAGGTVPVRFAEIV